MTTHSNLKQRKNIQNLMNCKEDASPKDNLLIETSTSGKGIDDKRGQTQLSQILEKRIPIKYVQDGGLSLSMKLTFLTCTLGSEQ